MLSQSQFTAGYLRWERADPDGRPHLHAGPRASEGSL